MSDKQTQIDAMWDALDHGDIEEREIAQSVKAFDESQCRCGGAGYLDASDVDPRVFHAAEQSGDVFATVGVVICPDPNCGNPRR